LSGFLRGKFRISLHESFADGLIWGEYGSLGQLLRLGFGGLRLRKRSAWCLAFLSILFVLSAAFNLAAAETYVVGVPAGTVGDYDFAQTWSQVNRARLEVTGVTTTVITFNETFYNPDNSVNISYSSSGLTYDVTNGLPAGLSGSIYPWFLAANLAVGTPAYSGAHIFVNETIGSYPTAGGTRTVNHSNQTFTSSGVPRSIFNAWWDKVTGLLVKFTFHRVGLGPYWVNLTLTGTSIWTPGYGLVGLGLGALILAAGAICIAIGVIFVAVAVQRRK
jgi:hypothetical protein